MNTIIVWSGAVLTVLLILGLWLYRQIKRALGVVSYVISRLSVEAYPAG